MGGESGPCSLSIRRWTGSMLLLGLSMLASLDGLGPMLKGGAAGTAHGA